MKKTVVIGASTDPNRYSFKALNKLKDFGHPIVPIGLKKGVVAGEEILPQGTPIKGADTISLYLNPQNQKSYYDYIVATKPKRVIFNPGTENDELQSVLEENGIPYIEACTLVLLSTGQY